METSVLSGRKTSAIALCLVILVCVPLGWRLLHDIDPNKLKNSFLLLDAWQWAAALAATLASYLALGRYDATWHGVFASGIGQRRAQRVGMAAVAVSQAVGMTALTAGLVRWRCLPDISGRTVAKISAAVGVSFLSGWAIVAGVSAVYLGLLEGWAIVSVAATLLILLPALPKFSSLVPAAIWSALPGLFGWVVLDIALAGTALWLLLPSDIDVGLMTIIASFALALGLGLIGNSPAGVGPFELTLIALLPHVPVESLLAGILAFRVVYYLVPFVCGALFLVQPPHSEEPHPPGPADWGIAHQCGAIERVGAAWAHVLRPWGIACILGDPVCKAGTFQSKISAYKAGRRQAAHAARRGWAVARIADDAVIDPLDWALEGRSKRRIRQALRRAAKQGVTARHLTGPGPVDELRRIAKGWSRRNGGELGLSMGRYCEQYLAKQRIYLIFVHGSLSGFVSFNTGPKDWSLDLIRYENDLPDGAIHSAIVMAIKDAANEQIGRLSLGAVPAQTGLPARWSSTKAGLRQFKALYDPSWRPLYMISPGKIRFLLLALALGWHIQRPLPRLMNRAHDLVASFGVVYGTSARHIHQIPKDDETDDTNQQCVDQPA